MKNRLTKIVEQLQKKPAWLRYRMLSFMLGSTVKFVGTAGVKCQELSLKRAVFKLANRKKVRNHIGTIHAAASVLVAETATGMALAMHLPDDKIPLLKKLQVDYLKPSKGALVANAHLTQQQIEQVHNDDNGSILIGCEVVDDSNNKPVKCEMLWAWIIKTEKHH